MIKCLIKPTEREERLFISADDFRDLLLSPSRVGEAWQPTHGGQEAEGGCGTGGG